MNQNSMVDAVVLAGFRGTIQAFQADAQALPPHCWNESVMRYHFCRSVALVDGSVAQHVECDRIDLVLVREAECAFIEFKYYVRPPRLDPYQPQKTLGFKGGPGPQNRREFEACIDRLHARAYVPGLSKYVALLYADPGDPRPRPRYADDYDEYRHGTNRVVIELVESKLALQDQSTVARGQLYRITGA